MSTICLNCGIQLLLGPSGNLSRTIKIGLKIGLQIAIVTFLLIMIEYYKLHIW